MKSPWNLVICLCHFHFLKNYMILLRINLSISDLYIVISIGQMVGIKCGYMYMKQNWIFISSILGSLQGCSCGISPNMSLEAMWSIVTVAHSRRYFWFSLHFQYKLVMGKCAFNCKRSSAAKVSCVKEFKGDKH